MDEELAVTRPRVAVVIGAIVAAVVLVGTGFVVLTGGDDASPRGRGAQVEDAVGVDCGPWDALGRAVTDAPTPDDSPLPVDDALRSGTLDNELRYLVRQNDRPGDSATVALAVDAGAALEDDDQHGGAHFLEHMLFNGTEGFPGNELQTVLRRLGVEFGADLNAFTSEDATVYYLEIPNDEASLDQGLDVLLEWATKATIKAEDVEAERGVVLEELRSRLGPEDRFFDRVRDLSLEGTRYEGHEVIGTVESLEAMTPEALRRFYEDWYRPDLMSVIAVGDFDPAAVEGEITSRFGAIPAAGPEAPERPALESEAPSIPRFASYVDDELGGTSAEVLFTRRWDRPATVADLRSSLLIDLALDALEGRFNEAADEGTVPFYEVDVRRMNQVREFETLMLSVDSEPEVLRSSLEALIGELAVARRDGFTDAEIARAVEVERAHSRAAEQGSSTTQDVEFLFRFVEHALESGPSATTGALAKAELALLDDVTAAEVTAAFREATGCGRLAMQAGAPEDYVHTLPDEDAIVAAFDAATAPSARSLAVDVEVPEKLMTTPAPAAPSGRADAGLYGREARYLEYPNGVRVILTHSEITSGHVDLFGESPGGLAAVADADLAHAKPAAQLVSDSGVASIGPVALDRLLVDSTASVTTSLSPDRELVAGSSSVADLETMLQLAHLRMSKPRIDDGALATHLGENRLIAEHPERRADSALRDAFDELFWRDDPRYRDLVTAHDLDALHRDRALDIYRERFGNASDFAFVIVGDIDLDAAEQLANHYLGTLPGTLLLDDATLRPPPPIGERASRTVRAGEAPQATVEVAWDVAAPVDPTLRDRAAVLAAALEVRLFDRLREQLGATYGPVIDVVPDIATQRVRTFVTVDASPDRIDEVLEEIHATVASFRDAPAAPEDVEQAVEPIRRDLHFVNHPQIAADWFYLLFHPDEPVENTRGGADARVAGVDGAVLQALATQLLPPGAYVEVLQLPEE